MAPGKKKSPKFPIEKISIGKWIRVSTYPGSLVAKCYLGEKKLIWKILDDDAPIGIQRLKKKIQIKWEDVLAISVDFSSPDGTEILRVELSKPPTFHMKIYRKPLTQTQTKWEKTDHDFTLNQASCCRRHKLHFPRGVLHENMKTLTSANKFWSDIINKPPTLPKSLYFDQYANIYNHGQTLSSSVNNHQSQGFGRVQSGEGNFSMATQFYPNHGRQINSFVQSNSENVYLYHFLVPQNNEQGSRGVGFPGQHYNNRLVQSGMRHIRNTVHPFPGAQATSQLSNELCSRRGGSQFGIRLVKMRNTAHHLLEEGTNQQYSRGGAQSYKPLFLGSKTDCEIVYGSSNSQGSGRERVTHTWYDDGSYVGVILDP